PGMSATSGRPHATAKIYKTPWAYQPRQRLPWARPGRHRSARAVNVPDSPVCGYSAAIMISPPLTRAGRALRSAAAGIRDQTRRQFITRNRRVAFGLAIATVTIGIAAVHVSVSWFSPGLMILPVLAGGLLL